METDWGLRDPRQRAGRWRAQTRLARGGKGSCEASTHDTREPVVSRVRPYRSTRWIDRGTAMLW